MTKHTSVRGYQKYQARKVCFNKTTLNIAHGVFKDSSFNFHAMWTDHSPDLSGFNS